MKINAIIQRILHQLAGGVSLDALTDVLRNLDCGQNGCFGHGTSNRVPAFAWGIQSSFPPRTAHKKSRSWFCDDTLAVSHLGQNHPENGGDAGEIQPTAYSAKQSCGEPEKTKSSQQYKTTEALNRLNLAVWSTLFYLLMKDLWPMQSPYLRLLISMSLSLLQPVIESLLEFLLGAFSWHKNEPDSKPPISSSENKQKQHLN